MDSSATILLAHSAQNEEFASVKRSHAGSFNWVLRKT